MAETSSECLGCGESEIDYPDTPLEESIIKRIRGMEV